MPGRWLRTFFAVATSVYAGVVVVLSLVPAERVPMASVGDKVQHVGGYAVLAGFWVLALSPPRTWRRIARVGAACVAMGVAIEFIQPYTGRIFDPADMLANAVGAALGGGAVGRAMRAAWVLRRAF